MEAYDEDEGLEMTGDGNEGLEMTGNGNEWEWLANGSGVYIQVVYR